MEKTIINTDKIRSIGYDIPTRTLEVELHSGDVHHYSDVPDLVYQGFLYSNSKDAYYASMFENNHSLY